MIDCTREESRSQVGEHTTTISIMVHVRPTGGPLAPYPGTDWIASFSMQGVEHCEHGKTSAEAVSELEDTINTRQKNRLAQIEKARRAR